MPRLYEKTIYTGTFICTPKLDSLNVEENLAIGVDEDGVIRHRSSLFLKDNAQNNDDFEDDITQVKATAIEWGWGKGGWKWVRAGNQGNTWWFPGFIDTHIHASQYPNTGLFGKTTLLSWLQTYTYPLEASLSSSQKARTVYNRCVARTLSHGTTTAAYYATAHAASTNILADVCWERGQRAFVGRVCMDTDLSPEYYRDESPEFAIDETKAVIGYINRIDPANELLTPILTPRFAPSCSAELLSRLGGLASETQLPIQTHISENTSEIALVKEKFPDQATYADVYAAHGLLTPRTVLAHGIHLSPPEHLLLSHHRACISHCPTSNTSLSSGLCPVRTLLNKNIRVGLGTDVSGGYSSSILHAARDAAMVSRTLAAVGGGGGGEEGADGDREGKKLGVEECLFLATRGGAECLGLGGRVGGFEVGMEWDAQFVKLDVVGEGEGGGDGGSRREGPVELWGGENWEEKLAKWLFCGDDRNTKKVYVKGRLVHEK